MALLGEFRFRMALTFVFAVFAVLLIANQASAATFTDLDSGQLSSCAISTDQHLYCWGASTGLDQEDDYTGPPILNEEFRPRRIYLVPGNLTDVSVGEYSQSFVPGGHSCAAASGAAYCWGYAGDGQLGTGENLDPFTARAPAIVSGLASGVTKISSGAGHTCAVVSGAAKCWGSNSSGQLGDGTEDSSDVPVQVSGLSTAVTEIAAGAYTSCAISAGAVSCWGYGWYGSLGNGTSGAAAESSVPVPTSIATGATKISSSGSFGRVCAVVSGGLKCWGAGPSTPTDVPTMTSGVTDVDVEADHVCATQAGVVKCFGMNAWGQLGNGTTLASPVVPVSAAGTGATAVSTGDDFSCAIYSGALKCWGKAGTQLGSPLEADISNALVPVGVLGGEGGAAASSITLPGGFEDGKFGCALVVDQAICWGDRPGFAGNAYSTSMPTGLSAGVTVISAGGGVADVDDHSFLCAVVSGAAKCLGNNADGQLGNNSTTTSSSLVQVSGLEADVTDISSGGGLVSGGKGFHTCAIVAGGARCWGANNSGQLGDGSETRSLVPVQVTGLTAGVTDISAGRNNNFSDGDNHTCAVVSGAVRCWGLNASGQLGDGTQIDKTTSVQVTGLTSGATQVAAGDNYTCAVVSSGAKCWGDGPLGGAGTSLTPVDVTGTTSGVTAIAAGFEHACAVVSGAAKCWGDNSFGQLGNGSTTSSSTPVTVSGLSSGVTAIAAGTRSSCAIQNDQIKCWGNGNNGRLGDGWKRDEMLAVPTSVLEAIDIPPPGGQTNPPGGGASTPNQPANPPAPVAPSIGSSPKSSKAAKAIKIGVSCATGCTMQLKLKVGKKSLKVPAVKVAAGSTSVTVKLSKSNLAKVKAALKKRQKVKLTVTLSDVTGASAPKTIKLK